MIVERHDDIRGGKNADGQRRPEDYRKALREWQRRCHRDHPQQNQEEREFVCMSVWQQERTEFVCQIPHINILHIFMVLSCARWTLRDQEWRLWIVFRDRSSWLTARFISPCCPSSNRNSQVDSMFTFYQLKTSFACQHVVVFLGGAVG